jgi:hypothetical protein
MDMNSETSEIYPELKKIENDIQSLKILLLKNRRFPRKIVKLEGSLKGEIAEKDIEEAKKSIFKFSD